MTETGSEAAIKAKEAFLAVVASAPESIRDAVEAMAWANTWAEGCYDASQTNAERWTDCALCAEAIIDAPADYGLAV